MLNSEAIKEFEKIILKIKCSTSPSVKKAYGQKEIDHFEQLLNNVIELQKKQEDFRSELITVMFEYNFKIEEIIKNIEESNEVLEASKKEERIEKLLGLI